MIELYCYLGLNMDIFVGDIGVGGCEVGYMVGMMKKLSNDILFVFMGKGLIFGGFLVCFEVMGYGIVYFVEEMLKICGDCF